MYEKVSETEFKQVVTETKEIVYGYEFLLNKKKQLEVELEEINNLIGEAKGLKLEGIEAIEAKLNNSIDFIEEVVVK